MVRTCFSPSSRGQPHSASDCEMLGSVYYWGPTEYTDHGDRLLRDTHLLLFKLQCLRLKMHAPSSRGQG